MILEHISDVFGIHPVHVFPQPAVERAIGKRWNAALGSFTAWTFLEQVHY